MQDVEEVGDAPCVGNDDVAIDVDADHGESEDEGDDDQEITDVEHRPLRMAHRTGAGDQLCGPAKEGVAAGADDDPFHLALLDDAARIGLVADLFRDRQGFAGQCRLVDRCEIATGEAKIRGNDHAQADFDDVTRHQCRRVNGRPFSVPQRGRFRCKALFQGCQGIRCLEILPQFESGIEQQQDGNDDEILPAVQDGRDDGRRLDHVGDRPGERPKNFSCPTHLLFDEGIGAVFDQSLCSLGFAQSGISLDRKLAEHLLDRNFLQIVSGRRGLQLCCRIHFRLRKTRTLSLRTAKSRRVSSRIPGCGRHLVFTTRHHN